MESEARDTPGSLADAEDASGPPGSREPSLNGHGASRWLAGRAAPGGTAPGGAAPEGEPALGGAAPVGVPAPGRPGDPPGPGAVGRPEAAAHGGGRLAGSGGAAGLADPGGVPGPGLSGGSLLPAGRCAAPGLAGQPAARRRLSGRLVAVLVAVALAGALAGGVAGGVAGSYLGSSPAAQGLEPGYRLGVAGPAVTGRSASSVAGVVARVLPSVVMIKVNGTQGTGSGFVISGGYIITDNHVVTLNGQQPHARLEVIFDGGRHISARLIGRDPYSDIAVLRPDRDSGLPPLQLGNSDGARVGDPVIAVGSPLGLAGTVTSGIISALDRPVQPAASTGTAPLLFYDAIQTDAPINPGNSGGPLVNGQGQVIGVNSSIDTLGADPITGSGGGSIGLGFAIPVNRVRVVATELIRTGHAAHAILGALINARYTGSGAQIVSSVRGGQPAITSGGPAALAGLRPGDVITRFAGLPIGTAAALLAAIRSQQPGSRVTVTYVRNHQTRVTRLTLGSATF
jgi:S1-C subfamily serine protease